MHNIIFNKIKELQRIDSEISERKVKIKNIDTFVRHILEGKGRPEVTVVYTIENPHDYDNHTSTYVTLTPELKDMIVKQLNADKEALLGEIGKLESSIP